MKTPTKDWTWPAAIIGLILFGMTMTFGLLFASRVDGGPEVIPDYYDKAVAWDKAAATRTASNALGWTAEVEHVETGRLSVGLRDASGKPITGIDGRITLTRPHLAAFSEVIPFRVDTTRADVNLPVTARGSGLWDVRIEANRNGERFLHVLRREWSLP